MSLTPQNLLTTSQSPLSLYFPNTHFKNPNSPLSFPSTHLKPPPHFQTLKTHSPNPHNFSFSPLRAFQSHSPLQNQHAFHNCNLDVLLSVSEVFCLGSLAVISIGSALNLNLVWLGSRVSLWQYVLLVGGVVIGAVIRMRQWRRICMDFSKSGSSGVNLVERIEKLEEDIGSSVTIVRVLSRQLEKLGIRFRVTRKALKEPIAEAVALVQKNSEVTRALAVQEDILEKELGEIQKFLLAMQDQQQKQLELICAIGKDWGVMERQERSESRPGQKGRA